MAELHRVEINEKAPSEIEPEDRQQTEAELPQDQSDRPEWLPEKFKSAEEMAQKLGAPAVAPAINAAQEQYMASQQPTEVQQ